MALPSVSTNCLIMSSMPRPKKIVGVFVTSATVSPASTFIDVFERVVAHLIGRLAGDALQDVVVGLEHLGHLVVHVGAEDEDVARQAGGLDGQGIGRRCRLRWQPRAG